jgi:hypothetical protein|tara:strand:+ start:359 stop:742 length:384 start_codon:yes stop_codon:yes gene_type:complete
MAYAYPENYLAYYIVGDRIALVTTKNTSSKNSWEAMDESQSDGLLIEYAAEPAKIMSLSDEPDCDNSLHMALVNYVKWKLFEDKQGKQETDVYEENKYKKLWIKHVRDEAARDKIGGMRAIAPFSLT